MRANRLSSLAARWRSRADAALVVSCVGLSMLSACATRAVPVQSPVAEARAAATGDGVAAEPPRRSGAPDADGYKRDAARRIYFRNAASLYDGAPPPVLKSLVVLAIRIDADGMPTRVGVIRSNGYRELEELAIRSVHEAAPLPMPRAALLTRGALEYYETWLFRDDHRFQVRSLADVQQTAD